MRRDNSCHDTHEHHEVREYPDFVFRFAKRTRIMCLIISRPVLELKIQSHRDSKRDAFSRIGAFRSL